MLALTIFFAGVVLLMWGYSYVARLRHYGIAGGAKPPENAWLKAAALGAGGLCLVLLAVLLGPRYLGLN